MFVFKRNSANDTHCSAIYLKNKRQLKTPLARGFSINRDQRVYVRFQ